MPVGVGLLIFVLLLQHPFVTYPLSLWLLRKWRGAVAIRRGAPVKKQTVDIVFCAYNEEAALEQKIANCLDLKAQDPLIEIRAYSDGSSDRTPDILSARAGEIDAVISTQRLGKSVGMDTLVRRSQADIIVFTDANTTLKADAVDIVRSYFADPEVGCVCGHLVLGNARESATANVGSAYWRLEQLIKKLETATGSTMGADGALFAIRRELFRVVPADIIDDMYTSLSTMCAGYRIVQSDDFVAYEPTVTKSGEEFRRKVRIACRSFNCARLLWPDLRRSGALNVYKFVSHKGLRWFAGLWMALTAMFVFLFLVLHVGLWFGALFALVAAGVSYAGYLRLVPLVGSLNEIALSFIATTLGVWKSLRGERFQTWTVAASARPAMTQPSTAGAVKDAGAAAEFSGGKGAR
jgi:cellulose synthase/poly-beta-1,6-N-acetylglucosamine synthase-like glycosyltransferase